VTPSDRAAEVTVQLKAAYGIDSPEREDDDPIGALVGTILSQHTNDINSRRAYERLRARYPTWNDVLSAPDLELADTIRVGGLANVKAARIKQCLAAIPGLDLSHLHNAALEDARRALRQLPGVGPKTAACVLLFNLGMPAIPVDTHVHRVSRRLGLIGPKVSADAAHVLLEEVVRAEDAYAFHVGLVLHGRRVCKALRPLCEECPLANLCDYYHRGSEASQGPAGGS
jgi:endonuclease-3